MNSRKYYKKNNTVEIRIYELLGIKLFRKAILLFERIEHIKDGGQNENYHLQDTSDSTLLRFSGYLIYNSVFHVVSLMLVVVYFAITRTLSLGNIAIDVVMVVVVVLNIYCLMLQRYIYLEFLKHINKKRQIFFDKKSRRSADIVDALGERNPENVKKEIAFLQEMQIQILSGNDVILEGGSEEILLNIAEVLKWKAFKIQNSSDDITFADLISQIPAKRRVISNKQYRVSRLQKVLKFDKKNNILFGVCVVTKNSTIEETYRKIFPYSTLDSVLEIIDVLLDAYHLYQKEMVQQ